MSQPPYERPKPKPHVITLRPDAEMRHELESLRSQLWVPLIPQPDVDRAIVEIALVLSASFGEQGAFDVEVTSAAPDAPARPVLEVWRRNGEAVAPRMKRLAESRFDDAWRQVTGVPRVNRPTARAVSPTGWRRVLQLAARWITRPQG